MNKDQVEEFSQEVLGNQVPTEEVAPEVAPETTSNETK
jgi:hypothetical protein